MKVYGHTLTPEQIEAGIGAMRGTFRMSDVERALIRAGVPNDGKDYGTTGRAADRLLQRERRAGRIKTNPENKREWVQA